MSPSGRMIAPRRRASSVTRWPSRSAGSCSPRSIPTMKPRPRTSATSSIAATPASSSPSRRIFGCRRSRVRSRSNTSRLAIAAAQASGLPVNVWPWKKVRNSSCVAEEALVDALGRQRRGERQVAAGQALGEAEEVGRRPAPARRRTSSRCGRSRSRPRRRSAARRGGRTARGPRAGSRAAGRGSRPPPGPAARRSPPRSPPSWLGEHPLELVGVARARTAMGVEEQRPVGARGRGRSRRPRPRRSCRRGRRRAGETNEVRRRAGRRAGCQYWNAIFSAISIAVEPESE